MKKSILIAFGCLLLAGCSAKYNSVSVTKSTELLARNRPVVISTSADGRYNTTTYSGSGTSTANAVSAAFARFTDNVKTIPACTDLPCLKQHSQLNEGYYVVPQILHWEDRATEWSGIPDKIEVKITVYNANSDNVVSSSILSGRSKWATFGGDHPQDLLAEPVNNYVATLY